MNKFAHSECTAECKNGCTESEDFGRVSGKIVEMVQKIREGSPLEQADAWIRTKHYTADRLKIERLSGDLLPLERCYINLAIVEGPKKTTRHAEERPEENAVPHTSPFSLATRLKVEAPNQNIQVELPSLFDPRKDSNGETIIPRRILIRGRAGIGKTTLCKKMVDEFARRSEDFRRWNELFDRVLWVPLRRLKEWRASQYDLQELFCHEFFARKEDRGTRTTLAKEMQRVVERGRTLFILDGMDEIAQELAGEGSKPEFFETLLNQPNVVITSRPHVPLPANVQAPDLELETIGFYPDQVKSYLQATFTNPKRVEDVQAYLQAHQLIQGLVRIPIQLDALCYTWDSFHGKAVPQTMTAIYRAIEESLWKKDVLRLENKDRLVTKDDIKDMDMDQIEDLVDDEVFLLEGLAFTGLLNDVINFGLEHRKAISKKFKLSNKWIPLDTTLPRLSFLRTSEPLEEDQKRDYHFLHLTFQEYFAARYFVRQWIDKRPLNCLQFSKGEWNEIEPATLLQEHKYDPRYDIFWRFVAGLLDADGEALGFFQAIEKEPRDLLGPIHQRLIMHCLSEAERKRTTFTELRTKLEKQLEHWLLFECDFTGDCWLAREMECPEQVLVNALTKASGDARLVLLRCLDSRAAVPSSAIDVAIPWLEGCTAKELCIAILRIVRHQHKALRNTMLQGIAARLEDEDWHIREAAIEALQGRADLTEEVLQGIAARLEDKDRNVRNAAIKALQGQADLTEEVLQGIAARLEDKDRDVRNAAIEALQGQANLTEEVVQGIAARLEREEESVRGAAIEALHGQANLTKEVVQGIAARLEDEEWSIRGAAIEALQGQANLTEEVLQGIAARLEDKDRDVRNAAIEALQGRADLTEGVLQGIAARLEHEDGDVRRAAIEALQSRASLTEKVLQCIAARLEHEDGDVRRAAIEALQGSANLTEEVVQGIAARLEDKDRDVRNAAIEALQGQANLTEEVVQGIAARLEREEESVRRAAIEALQGRANLTKEVVQGIAARLEDEELSIRGVAIEALHGQANLTEEVLQGIAARLEDEGWSIRRAAIEALQGRANLTEEMVRGIAARLEDEDGNVQQAAIKALQGRADLTEEVLQGIVARLRDKDWRVQKAAMKALQGRADLTEEVLQGIAARLEHEGWSIRRAAIEALQGRANLTEGMVRGIAARLEDEDGNVQQAAIKALQGRADLTEEVLQGIVARLRDKDWRVQKAAMKALQGRADLTEEVLQGIAARLEHEEGDVRRAAIEALQGCADLIEEVLQGIVARLEDEVYSVREKAIEALRGRADLTEKVLQGIAARLEHEKWYVRETAIEALVTQAALPLEVLGPHVKPLYQALLHNSFKQHLYWCPSFIAVELRYIALYYEQEHQSCAKIWEMRIQLGVPFPVS